MIGRPDFNDLYNTYPPKARPTIAHGCDRWELYDLNTDFNEVHNIADKYPRKLKSLRKLFDAEAKANHVYPLITWSDSDIRLLRNRAARAGGN